MVKKNITLCLDDDVIEALEKTGNKSGTTNDVLIDYFNIQSTLEEVKEKKVRTLEDIEFSAKRLKREIEEIDERIKIRNEERAKVEEEKAKKEAEEQEILKAEQRAQTLERRKTPEFIDRFKSIQKPLFLDYDVEETQIDELLIEFLNLYQKDKVRNIIEFMEKKGIKEKPKEDEEK